MFLSRHAASREDFGSVFRHSAGKDAWFAMRKTLRQQDEVGRLEKVQDVCFVSPGHAYLGLALRSAVGGHTVNLRASSDLASILAPNHSLMHNCCFLILPLVLSLG